MNFNQLARMSTQSMLNCMLEGMAIGLFAWILLRIVGRRNSSTRFAVWFSALLAIAALPVLGVVASNPRSGSASSAITVPGLWALDIFLVWAAMASVALFRVGVGLWQLRKLRASCFAIDHAALDPVLLETLRGFQAVRSVALCQSDRLQVPTAIGFLKPMVVIPSWAMSELSTAQLNSILIHELAHLRRRDDWTNLAQRILKALLFFHPAVWWIESQLALEREMACDDAVLAETANPRGYAQCLIAMAEKSFLRRGLVLAQAAVNRMRPTSRRVSQILDVNRSRATGIWKPALYSVAAFVVVCLVSFSHAPELVAFEDRMPDAAIRSATPATLVSAAKSNFSEKQAVATPVSFRIKSAGPSDPPTRLAETPTQTRRAAETLIGTDPAALMRMRQIRGNTTSVLARAGTASVVPQRPRENTGFHPLGRRALEGSKFAAADKTVLARRDSPQNSARPLNVRFVQPHPAGSASAFEDRIVTGQTILVVMQSAEYEPAGPVFLRISVWRVTILDSSRISAETRIPAKQI
jgi:beta-lactamase regulating signal transducer with metallopeptidase domain